MNIVEQVGSYVAIALIGVLGVIRMKQEDKGYPHFSEDRLSYIYRCVKCRAHIKKGLLECYRCDHIFTPNDVNNMIREYRDNYSKNWHHKIYFVVFMLLVVAFLASIN